MDWSVVLPQVGVGSGWALVVLFVTAIMRGQLVPRRTHEDAIHDRDEWRAESRLKDAQIVEKDKQLSHMGEVGRNVLAIMQAVRASVDSQQGSQSDEDVTR
ncbi:hypothetical protein [Nocardioides sp. Arc9.136]|uniref:hypothetical protein n=1 Tax=Nocardioides sp. Arc9.136 TaxID=2996826 RepID=UPI002666FD1C|nr:hypothetical protein [Nocardioides sp. Arc9.136]WKN47159.1 hypothetical protein OSR43_14035 [Nocardioides sp. Arc9.136]